MIKATMSRSQFSLNRLTQKDIDEAELRGFGKCLDLLWENSYYVRRMDERIRTELEYFFGKNWSRDMYDFIGGGNVRPTMPKTLKELRKQYK